MLVAEIRWLRAVAVALAAVAAVPAEAMLEDLFAVKVDGPGRDG
jgi:hypothetical protein